MNTITGGAGADIITASTGDTFVVTAATESNISAYDVYGSVTNAMVETLSFTLKNQGTVVGVAAGKLTATITDLSGAADLAEAIGLLLAGDGGTNAIVTWGVYDGVTYLAEDLTDGAAASTDIVVSMTGSLDLLAGTNLMITFA